MSYLYLGNFLNFVHLKKFPWVCNGCPKHSKCRLNKYYYYSDTAQKDYLLTLKIQMIIIQ